MKCDKCQNKAWCYDGNHELTRHGCAENNWCCFSPITNADRIRAMSDEELAVWMVQWTDCYECVARTRGCCQSDESCASSICNWLKQEADNGK